MITCYSEIQTGRYLRREVEKESPKLIEFTKQFTDSELSQFFYFFCGKCDPTDGSPTSDQPTWATCSDQMLIYFSDLKYVVRFPLTVFLETHGVLEPVEFQEFKDKLIQLII